VEKWPPKPPSRARPSELKACACRGILAYGFLADKRIER
jgi:hypothetical protein